jgi:hypothetical protein
MSRAVAIAITPPEQRLLLRILREHLAREDCPAAVDLAWMVEHALDARTIPAFFSDTAPERVEGLA